MEQDIIISIGTLAACALTWIAAQVRAKLKIDLKKLLMDHLVAVRIDPEGARGVLHLQGTIKGVYIEAKITVERDEIDPHTWAILSVLPNKLTDTPLEF